MDIDAYFKDYASHHKTPGNKLCHYFGVPVITATALGLLGNLPVAGGLTGSDYIRVDGGTLLLAVTLVWYLWLDWKISIPFGFFGMGLYFLGRAIPVPALVALFVIGWIVQYIGHYVYEKKSPAFYKNVIHFLIGPLWIFARWVKYI
jgi:uncharacterized membrane protein YGL010W